MTESKRAWRGVVPLLQVGSIEETLTYYEEVLGFSVDFVWPQEGPAKWAAASHGDVTFMFTMDLGESTRPFLAEKGNGAVFYIVIEDVETLYDELCEHGAIIVQDMHQFGERKQFSIGDLNGYILAFSEPFDRN
jgi:uncharacterized glyoxalase superfamily protein PhnB